MRPSYNFIPSGSTINPFMKATQKMSAKRFLRLIRTQRETIGRTSYIPPKLGSSGFGYFYVEYKYGSKPEQATD